MIYYNKKLNPLTLEEYKSEECIKAFQKYWNKNSNKKNFELGRLRISLTEKCNFNCPFCYNEGMKKGAKSFRVEEISAILEASEGIVKRVKLTGGEPLLHEDIEEIIELSSKKFLTSITTNGSLLSKISSIVDKLSGISVSMHSLENQEYKKLTGSSYSPDEIIRKVLDLKKISNVPISLNMVVNKFNVKNLKHQIEQMADLGIENIQLIGMLINDNHNMELYYPLDKLRIELESWFGQPEIMTASQLKYKIKNSNTYVELIYQYCMIGCNVCRTNGFIRISPKPDISYCLAKETISLEKEIKDLDVNAIRKAMLSAIDLMG